MNSPRRFPDRMAGWGPRLLAAVALLAAMVLLAACGGGSSSSSSTEPEAGGEPSSSAAETETTSADVSDGEAGAAKGAKVVALLPESFPYLAPYQKALESAATKLGLELQVLNAQGEPQTQSSQMTQVVSEGVEGLILWPADPKAIVPTLAQVAASSEIPIVNSNAKVDESGEQYISAYTGPNDFLCGEAEGKAIAQALNDKGNILLIEGAPGQAPTVNRKKGLEKYLEENAPEIKILASQPANWDQATAQNVTSTLLTKYGSEIQGLVAQDDSTAAGAIQAIQSAGLKDIKVVGNGGSKAGIENIENGSEYATPYVSPVWDGEHAAEALANLLEGKEQETPEYMPLPVVTKANTSKYPGLW